MANECPKCRHENAAGVEVCSECAAPLQTKCHICGFQNPPNFKFCGNCGSNLSGAPILRPEDSRRFPPRDIPIALAEKMLQVGKQIEGERRNVTVLFADLCGFTGISEKLDPEQVYRLIDSTLRAFTDQIYTHEGTLDRFTGDGVMALFGAPVAHEDDPARAIRAALGMREALARLNEVMAARLGVELKARMGLNSGTVVVGSLGSDLRLEYTALGDTVNVASRLQTLAEPGTIFASGSVYEQTKPIFRFRELGSIRVRGRVEPVEIYEVQGALLQAGRVRGIPGIAAPMVGREEEFARLRQIVSEMLDKGQGHIVLVTGGAGIGKSRLTSELKGYLATKPITVLEGACLVYGQGAYGVFLRLLRSYFGIAEDEPEATLRVKVDEAVRHLLPDQVAQVLPYIQALFSIRILEKEFAERVRHLEPAQLQQQIFLAVRMLLSAQARKQPLVLIFEDIHWIDKISLDLLSFLLNSVEQAPLVIYCNSRPAEGNAAPKLRQLGADIFATRFTHLPLAPLSYADSVALMDLLLSIAQLPERLKEVIPQRAEGNPFFLEEIIRMLIDRGIVSRVDGRWELAVGTTLSDLEVPSTLQGLIMTRFDHLSEGARQALGYASVIGRDFSRRLLSAVVEGTSLLEDDLAELEERELISRILDAPEEEYRFHHILIQETVYHSLLILRREQMHHRIAEGIRAVFKGRTGEYVEQLAFHYAESKDAASALPFLIQAGDHAAGRFANDQALHYYRLAEDFMPEAAPSIEDRIQVYSGLGQVNTLIGDYDSALKSYVHALDLTHAAKGVESSRASGEIMRRISRVHEQRGDYVQALALLDGALADLERDPLSEKAVERARTYNDIGRVHYRRGQMEEAYQWRMRSLQILEGTDNYNEMASVYNGLVGLFTRGGDWSRAIAYAEKGLRLREMIGDSYGVSSSHNNLGSIALEQCDLDKALYHFEHSLDLKQRIGDVEGISRLSSNLGMVCRDKGDYDRARDLFRQALDIAERIKNGAALTLALNNLASVKILQRNYGSAVEDLNRSIIIATQMGYKERLAEAHWLLAESYLGMRFFDDAEGSAKQALKLATDIGRQYIEGAVLRTFARIARAHGDVAASEGYLQQSILVFGKLNNPFELARSQFELGLVRRDRGSISQARSMLETALDTFGRLGAVVERQNVGIELEHLSDSPLPLG